MSKRDVPKVNITSTIGGTYGCTAGNMCGVLRAGWGRAVGRAVSIFHGLLSKVKAGAAEARGCGRRLLFKLVDSGAQSGNNLRQIPNQSRLPGEQAFP